MPRSNFGGTAGDFVASIGPGGLVHAIARATLTFWTAETGGTQHTDLLLDGNPVTTITVDTDGQVPTFQGPDNVAVMWADAGGNKRVKLISDKTGAELTSDAFVGALLADNDSATTAGVRRQQGRVFTPEQFGAIGDGTPGENVLIQQAIDFCSAIGGGTVRCTQLYGCDDEINVKPGVTLEGLAVRQKPVSGHTPGLLATGPDFCLKGGGGIGGVRYLYVDGDDIAGGDASAPDIALVRFGFASNAHFDQLHAVGSSGHGVSFAGTQNSSVAAIYSHDHVGTALILCGGAGALTFYGGHCGTAARALWITDGDEASAYPFGPVQNTFVGTIFELYDNPNVTERIGCVEVDAGANNVFTGCNFTGNTNGTTNNAVILLASRPGLPPTSIELDSCIYALGVTDTDVIRVVGLQSLAIDGHHYAGVGFGAGDAFICQDTGFSTLMLRGYVQGPTADQMFRTINGGSEIGWTNQQVIGETKRFRSGQASFYQRETDALGAFRGYIDRDFTHAWSDGTGALKAAIAHNGAGVIYNSSGMWQEKAAGAVVTSVSVVGAGQTVTVDATTTSHVNLGFAVNCTIGTLNLNNGVEGQHLRLGWFGLSFANAGANTIAWPANVKWAPGRAAPDIRAATNNAKVGFVAFTYANGFWCESDRSERQSTVVTTYTAPQTHTAYPIPAGATRLKVRVQGAAGGGGSGRRGAAGTVRCGGGGGGGGGYSEYEYEVSSLGVSTLYVTVGTGGAGGAAVTAGDTNGNNGVSGSASSVKTTTGATAHGNTLLLSNGGGPGLGGTNATGLGGVAAYGRYVSSAGAAASVTGGAGAAGAHIYPASGDGGGSGGGITAADAQSAGGAGSAGNPVAAGSPAAGTAGGGVGTIGVEATFVLFAGSGAAGGGSNTGGAGGAGGAGARGSGGGGGGASVNGNNSGAGGKGGDGFVEIAAYFD